MALVILLIQFKSNKIKGMMSFTPEIKVTLGLLALLHLKIGSLNLLQSSLLFEILDYIISI